MNNHFYIVICRSLSEEFVVEYNPVAYFKSESKATKFLNQIQKEAIEFHPDYKYSVEKRNFDD